MTCCNAAFTNCNAKAYYNHIIPEVAVLAQYQARLPDPAATFFLQTLKQMKYHMVTGYEVDTITVENTTEDHTYGISF